MAEFFGTMNNLLSYQTVASMRLSNYYFSEGVIEVIPISLRQSFALHAPAWLGLWASGSREGPYAGAIT